jgi:methionyl-tRNA formyltransferase
VLDDQLTVACGKDAVTLVRLQRAGRDEQATNEFLRGWPVQVGEKLGG